MKLITFVSIIFLSVNCTYGQSYKIAFRADMCECLEQESLRRKLTDKIYSICFKEILPKYATQIDVQIVEEDLNKKYRLGQIARKDLILALKYELVYTCDTYFNYLESEKLSKKLIARDHVKESELVSQNQYVALSPNALAYFTRAQLHYNLGNFKEAEADINKSIEVNPYSENAKSTRRELMLLALIYEEQERYNEAIVLFDKVYFGEMDSQVAVLRALVDRKAGGSVASIPKLTDNKLLTVDSRTRNRRQPDTKITAKRKSARKIRIKKEKTETKKKTDTVALKKLFKIDN